MGWENEREELYEKIREVLSARRPDKNGNYDIKASLSLSLPWRVNVHCRPATERRKRRRQKERDAKKDNKSDIVRRRK